MGSQAGRGTQKQQNHGGRCCVHLALISNAFLSRKKSTMANDEATRKPRPETSKKIAIPALHRQHQSNSIRGAFAPAVDEQQAVRQFDFFLKLGRNLEVEH